MAFLMTGGMVRLATSYRAHRHSFWEIVLYTRGEGIVTVDGRRIAFRPGTIVCTPPQAVHEEESRDGFQNNWVAIDELQAAGDEVPVINLYREHPIFAIVEIMHAESHLRKPTSEILMANLFGTFMTYLNEHLAHEPHERIILHLMRVIGANVPNPGFRISDAMASIPLSTDHLRRLFKERVGQSPIEYLIELRLTRAKELLQMGFSVKETADKVGITDQYYFSRLFKRREGCSPSEYGRGVRIED
ncbi:MAG: helix-turn-helix domain-containing protein [Chitinivibrionales bacterium]|nr:helix-turn-helix domain-containing protein [Chitinivibrionales bacterium]